MNGNNLAFFPGPDDSPPPYLAREPIPDWRLSCADFPPRCLDAGGILAKARFERFDVLVARANRWLEDHPNVRVKTCESLELSCPPVREGGAVDTSPTVHSYTASQRFHFRALRLWIVPRQAGDVGPAQQIGYLNILPACIHPGGILTKPVFDSLENTLFKFNQLLKRRPLAGHVICTETMRVKFCQWRSLPDVDCCYWRDHSYFRTSYLRVVRVFYSTGPNMKEEIGWKDFVPRAMGQACPNVFPRVSFEGTQALMERIRHWLSQQPYIARITNVQTVRHKLRGVGRVDMDGALLSDTPLLTTWYVQSLRVYYVYQCIGENSDIRVPCSPQQPLLSTLNCKTFFPAPEATGVLVFRSQKETIKDTLKQATSWLNSKSGVHIISAETLESPMSTHRGQIWQSHNSFILQGAQVFIVSI